MFVKIPTNPCLLPGSSCAAFVANDAAGATGGECVDAYALASSLPPPPQGSVVSMEIPTGPCLLPGSSCETFMANDAACTVGGARVVACAPALSGAVSPPGVFEPHVPILSEVALSGGNSAKALFRSAYWKLDPRDRSRLHEVITDTSGIEGRSFSFALKRPIEIDGCIYRALRCKGIAPKHNASGKLFGHDGDGYDRMPLCLREDGFAFIGEASRNPEGSAFFDKARHEFEHALRLGPELTDFALGFGKYDGLSFLDRPVGFTIYAMREGTDKRVASDILDPGYRAALNRAPKIDFEQIEREFGCVPFDQMRPAVDFERLETELGLRRIFVAFGRALRAMHERGMVHRYPHLNNIGIEADRVVLRDLDTVVDIRNMSPVQRIAWLTLDFMKVVRAFAFYQSVACSIYSNGSNFTFNLAHLTHHFFEGYFRESFEDGELMIRLLDARCLDIYLGVKLHLQELLTERPLRVFGDRLVEMYAPEL